MIPRKPIPHYYPVVDSDPYQDRMEQDTSVPGSIETENVYKTEQSAPFNTDIEQNAQDESHLMNDYVKNYVWQGVTVTVNDHKTKQPKRILENVSGVLEAGEMCALMGPSGCGKTTLLNVLAHRDAVYGGKVEGSTLVNGNSPAAGAFRRMTSFVEQEDALIGSLTVRETMHFAARLAHKNSLTKNERKRRIDGLLDSFGLRDQANTLIGTPIRKGISGGQKRRVSVASQLITAPKILFLDEPTSGLDSTASWEVMSFIKGIAKRNNLIVIASIHQPSTSTFQLFDKLLLLSQGKPNYFGPVTDVDSQFSAFGHPIPLHTNPAEFLLELVNVDFAVQRESAAQNLQALQTAWSTSPAAANLTAKINNVVGRPESMHGEGEVLLDSLSDFPGVVATLVHRAWIKSYRDVVAYGIRIAMYLGLAIMMGTVWVRLKSEQEYIQPFINAIFFGSAFMSFMAVAYVPSFLEDRLTFVKERHNGLYGPTAFMLSNFIIGLPYLFLISVLFSTTTYWLTNFNPTASHFFTWILLLYLDLLAAESLVILFTSLFPVFVIALALTAFANGLWMSVGGFLLSPTLLNPFYKYVFHYIDYQAWVFAGMMVNEFADRTYKCTEGVVSGGGGVGKGGKGCVIQGTDVLKQYGYEDGHMGEWVGIIVGIIVGYRLLGLLALYIRR